MSDRIKTVEDLDNWLREQGADAIADALRGMTTYNGYFRFWANDPIEGPYTGDEAQKRRTAKYGGRWR